MTELTAPALTVNVPAAPEPPPPDIIKLNVPLVYPLPATIPLVPVIPDLSIEIVGAL